MVETSTPALLTADDFAHVSAQSERVELIRGVLSEFPPPRGHEHGEVTARLVDTLVQALEEGPLGRITVGGAGVRLERNPDTVRVPDIAITLATRLPPGELNGSYSDIAPDLVVEIVAPSTRRAGAHDKARMWVAHGVGMAWVADPDMRSVHVYRSDEPVRTVYAGESIDGGAVLPGLRSPVESLF